MPSAPIQSSLFPPEEGKSLPQISSRHSPAINFLRFQKENTTHWHPTDFINPELNLNPPRYLPAVTEHQELATLLKNCGIDSLVKANFAHPDQIEVIEEFIKRRNQKRSVNQSLKFGLDADVGSGKTFDAIMFAALTIAEAAKKIGVTPNDFENQDCKIVYMIKSTPLIHQFKDEIIKFLKVPEEHIITMYGANEDQEERRSIWESDGLKIIIATYQTVENDLAGRPKSNHKFLPEEEKYHETITNFADASIKIFIPDEAHNSTGEHGVVRVGQEADRQIEKQGLIIDRVFMTASIPGRRGKKPEKNREQQLLFFNSNGLQVDDLFVAGKPNLGEEVQINNLISICNIHPKTRAAINLLEQAGSNFTSKILDSLSNIERNSSSSLDIIKERIIKQTGGVNGNFFSLPSRQEITSIKKLINSHEKSYSNDYRQRFYEIRLKLDCLEYLKLATKYFAFSTPYAFFAAYTSLLEDTFKIHPNQVTDQRKRGSIINAQKKHFQIFRQPEIKNIFKNFQMMAPYDLIGNLISENSYFKNGNNKKVIPFYSSPSIQANLLDHYLMSNETTYSKKTQVLLEYIEDVLAKNPDSTLMIWCRYRSTVNYLNCLLQDQGYSSADFMGGAQSKNQLKQQSDKLEKVKNGEINILPCTIAFMGEGINFENLQHGIFFDAPNNWQEYIQCCGRLGRLAGLRTSHSILRLATVANFPYQEEHKYIDAEAGANENEVRRVKEVNQRREAVSHKNEIDSEISQSEFEF